MNGPWETVAVTLAAIPAALFFWNLLYFRRLPSATETGASLSVLIPARNEEASIRAALDSVLTNRGVELEVIVCDDGSTDRTAAIVEDAASKDQRVRLLRAPRLPPQWCGKQFACHTLASEARHPILCFLDADVRLRPDALARMTQSMSRRRISLLSGFPRQITIGLVEQLLIPLIHFVLLGYLPMVFARYTRFAAFAAGCGQLMMVRADDYSSTGGHSAIRQSLHDGIQLPRLFRKSGLRTDVFDATDAAECRMYATAGDVWLGLSKNATEGMAAPVAIFVFTALLAGGQLLPWALAAAEGWTVALAAAVGLTYLPRIYGVARFQQPWLGAVLHPVGVVGLLAIQWFARVRAWRGRPAVWKARQYSNATDS